MSIWHLFVPERQRKGPANPAKGEVTCHACGRVRHISDLAYAAAKKRQGIDLIGGCKTCGGRSWNFGNHVGVDW